MNYQKLEDDIVKRLEPLRALGFEVLSLPEQDADYTKPFAKGRVTVGYKSSLYNDDGFNGRPMVYSTAEIVQKETAIVEILIQGRNLRGANGVHWLKDAVTKQIIGWKTTDFNRIYSQEYRFVEHADGIWTYALTLFCQGLQVQHVDQETLPLLQQVTVFVGDDPANVINVGSVLAANESDPDGGVYTFPTGQAFSLKYEFVNPNNLPYDLTGYTFRWAVKQFVTDPSELILKTPTATGNVVYGTASAFDNDLVAGTYKAILEVRNPDNTLEQEIVNTVVITPQII